MKDKLQEMRNECDRLMHNLKSSNRLLDEVNKEKRHAEYERDTMVKYYTSFLCAFNNNLFFAILLGPEIGKFLQIMQ